jgi:hypothetical protein
LFGIIFLFPPGFQMRLLSGCDVGLLPSSGDEGVDIAEESHPFLARRRILLRLGVLVAVAVEAEALVDGLGLSEDASLDISDIM